MGKLRGRFNAPYYPFRGSVRVVSALPILYLPDYKPLMTEKSGNFNVSCAHFFTARRVDF
jgi:hypothetical protein